MVGALPSLTRHSSFFFARPHALTLPGRKIPWRLSKFQKRRQRHRLQAVDAVVATIDQALARQGETLKNLERWKAEMPTEAQMRPKDKYTIFDRKEKKYRKGIHSKLSFFSPFLRRPSGALSDGADAPYSRIAQVDESVATH